jgi:hypothetical protein
MSARHLEPGSSWQTHVMQLLQLCAVDGTQRSQSMLLLAKQQLSLAMNTLTKAPPTCVELACRQILGCPCVSQADSAPAWQQWNKRGVE